MLKEWWRCWWCLIAFRLRISGAETPKWRYWFVSSRFRNPEMTLVRSRKNPLTSWEIVSLPLLCPMISLTYWWVTLSWLKWTVMKARKSNVHKHDIIRWLHCCQRSGSPSGIDHPSTSWWSPSSTACLKSLVKPVLAALVTLPSSAFLRVKLVLDFAKDCIDRISHLCFWGIIWLYLLE